MARVELSALLISAADSGDLAVVGVALQGGAVLECQSEEGWQTPLSLAAQKGNAAVVQLLLKRGADKETRSKVGATPLHYAARHGRLECMRLLLEQGADNESKTKAGRTPLHSAVRGNQLECVRLLLAHGVNKGVKDKDGKTPLEHVENYRFDNVFERDAKDAIRALLRTPLPRSSAGVAQSAAAEREAEAVATARRQADAAGKRIIAAQQAAQAEASRREAQAAAAAAGERAKRQAEADAAAGQRIFAAQQAAQGEAAKRKANAAAVPAEIASWLATLQLSEHGPRLVADHKLKSVDNCRFLQESDLIGSGLVGAEARRMLDAVAKLGSNSQSLAPSVMISYRVSETGEDGDKAVFALQKALESRGYSVFVGEEAIQGASNWPSTIQKGVEDCSAFVILCSATYGDEAVSPWTKRELELADNLKKPLFPVWHSGPYPPKAVTIYFSGKQRIPTGNLTEGYAKAKVPHERVAEELAAALARAGVTPTAALQWASRRAT